MNVITSTISDRLAEVYSEWEETFGIGPCGAFAALKREEGWGKVASCTASEEGDEIGFAHYVIIDTDGSIIDMSNPLDAELTYSEIEILEDNEMPEMVGTTEIEWLRTRGV